MRRMTTSLLLVTATLAGAPVTRAARPLPANRWVLAECGGGGVRRGAAAAWLPAQKQFLVVGGAFGNEKKGIARPFEIETFDPRSARWKEAKPAGLDVSAFEERKTPFWQNEQGQLRLNPQRGVADDSVFDAAAERLLTVIANDRHAPDKLLVAAYDVAQRSWSVLADTKPTAEADGLLPGEWGPTCTFLEGTAVAHDPVRGELLLIGGRTGNAPRGFVGHWAFSLTERKWRRLTARSGLLDPLREKCSAVVKPARDGLAAARNVWHSPRDQNRDVKAVKAEPAALLRRASKLSEQASAALRAAKAMGWEAKAVCRAALNVDFAAENLGTAAEALAAGRLDAALIKQIFDAVWKIDEAIDFLRVMPGPRMRAAAGYDAPGRSGVRVADAPVFLHARLQPFVNQAQQHTVTHPTPYEQSRKSCS